ncbi:hypothetical protein EJ08DRAFT_645891 [Tothia fuscella]|uniref:Uncharacterized protein n=1 Tax=Tothia fuscella TaxID=1048955 RepID=A0A9P4P1I5_9PEZI|nr:hypothetical protein EJ08DRAFT_645891 [Tothia fuscella]
MIKACAKLRRLDIEMRYGRIFDPRYPLLKAVFELKDLTKLRIATSIFGSTQADFVARLFGHVKGHKAGKSLEALDIIRWRAQTSAKPVEELKARWECRNREDGSASITHFPNSNSGEAVVPWKWITGEAGHKERVVACETRTSYSEEQIALRPFYTCYGVESLLGACSRNTVTPAKYEDRMMLLLRDWGNWRPRVYRDTEANDRLKSMTAMRKEAKELPLDVLNEEVNMVIKEMEWHQRRSRYEMMHGELNTLWNILKLDAVSDDGNSEESGGEDGLASAD